MAPLIVILGETASGKSALALELAKKIGGEIVCADSRTVYTGMDIGTAKPSKEERASIQHYGLDVVAPGEPFNVADFKKLADEAIKDIQNRGKVPILVGGTGLYIDAVLYDFEFLPASNPTERGRLIGLSVDELQAEIEEKGLPMPENSQNPRHLQRVIETGGQKSTKHNLRENTLVIGLSVPRDVLKERIIQRTDAMMEAGLVREIQDLSQKYGWDVEAMRAPAYKAFRSYLEGDSSLEEAKQAFIQNDLNLAKKQRTWFKRNPDIHWFADATSALAFAENWLIENKSSGQKAMITKEA